MIVKGIGASKGIAVGPIRTLVKTDLSVEDGPGSGAESECKRLEEALAQAGQELSHLYEKAKAAGSDSADVFSVHQMMLEDPEFTDSIRANIQAGHNAQWAVACTRDEMKAVFDAMDDAYMRARGADVMDISNRLIRILKGEQETALKTGPCILAAEDLYPSDTVKLDKNAILGFITRRGSSTSHSVILARAMGIPCIVGLENGFDCLPKEGEIWMDGGSGEVAIDPAPEEQAMFSARRDMFLQDKEGLQAYWGREAITGNGHKVQVCANIGSPQDAEKALKAGADGVGLFRSEFIYLGRDSFPSEEEQFEAYKTVLKLLAPRPVVIRTLDLGSDKQADYFQIPREDNPALGYRAIRICLKQQDIFRTQLRALYRASAFGNLSIMFPMISHIEQLRLAKKIAAEVQDELAKEGISTAKNVPLGMMVETPAAALLADTFAKEADFFSIGTNDLTQYTLAADRLNPNVNDLFDSANPAVLKAIAMTAKAAHENGIWVGICGESAANTALTSFYMSAGIDELSVSPSLVTEVRRAVIESK